MSQEKTTLYTIGFRNGHKINIEIKDPKVFIENVTRSLQGESKNNYYIEPNIIICVSDITVCCPSQVFENKI